jgi:hypothetical protein
LDNIHIGPAQPDRLGGSQPECDGHGVEGQQAIGAEFAEETGGLCRGHRHDLLLHELGRRDFLGHVLGDQVIAPGVAEGGAQDVAEVAHGAGREPRILLRVEPRLHTPGSELGQLD